MILSPLYLRIEEKQKRKLRRKIQIEQGLELPPSRKRLKKNRMVDSSNKQKVAIDCAFDELMGEKVDLNVNCQICIF